MSSKEKFRNSSAAFQRNYTSGVITKFYRGWLEEEAVQIEEDREFSSDKDEFDPETKEGGDPSFQGVHKKIKELNRNLGGVKSFLIDSRRRVHDIFRIGRNEMISQYYFVESLDIATEDALIIADRLKDGIKAINDNPNKDALYILGLDSLDLYYQDNIARIVDFFNVFGIAGDVGKQVRNSIDNFRNSLDDMKNGFKNVELVKLGGIFAFIPDNPQLDIFYLYDGLPSNFGKIFPKAPLKKGQKPFVKVKKLDYRISYQIIKNTVEPNPMVDIKHLPKALGLDFVKFTTKLIGDMVEINTQFNQFNEKVGSVSDLELKEFIEELEGLDAKFDDFVKKFFYRKLVKDYVPNIITDIQINISVVDQTNLNRSVENMSKLMNDSYKKFVETYFDSIKNLKGRRNI
jgi:hypothetical protein